MKAMRMGFQDRAEAGRQLARLLARLADEKPVVLAVTRGGVPVGAEIAASLGAPLEVLVVRKLQAVAPTDGTVGALAEGDILITDEKVEPEMPAWLAELCERERAEIVRRVGLYRDGRELPSLEGRTVIIVDDGASTGMTARAAVAAARRLQPARLVVAVPVGSLDVIRDLKATVDEVVCVETRLALWAIGLSYSDFKPVDDEEVLATLARFC
jgi:putative phosphoribosyl transferase